MSFIESFIIGMVQGLTEFLPVSSSGHLSLIEKFFALSSESLILEVGVHIGTVLSILIVYRKMILQWLKQLASSLFSLKPNDGSYLFALVIVSAVPAGLVGIMFKEFISMAFSNLLIVGLCFIITGCILYWTEAKIENKSINKDQPMKLDFDNLGAIKQITIMQALIIGLAQALAILPGISRSGSTIAVGLSLGVPRSTAAMFSFIMSVPVILGAGLLQLKTVSSLNYSEIQHLLFAILISFLFGLVGLLLILYFVKKARLSTFSWYLWLLGTGSIVYYFLRG